MGNLRLRKSEIKTQDGICDVVWAEPNDTSSFPQKNPGLLFYMDGFGVRPYLEEMATQFASMGFVVLLPNLLYRIKPAPVFDFKFPLKMEDMAKAREVMVPLVRSFDYVRGMLDAEAYIEALIAHPQVDSSKICITGYCMGGGLALRTAAHLPSAISAIASFHSGGLATEAENSPHLLLPKVKARLYFGHADNDTSMPPEQIARFETALRQTQINYRSELYKGAMHGYTMKDLPAYNETALRRHWEIVREYLL